MQGTNLLIVKTLIFSISTTQTIPRNINETIIWYIQLYVWYTLILPIQFENVLLHCYMYVTMNLLQ